MAEPKVSYIFLIPTLTSHLEVLLPLSLTVPKSFDETKMHEEIFSHRQTDKQKA